MRGKSPNNWKVSQLCPTSFVGFFAPHAEGLMEAVEERWPGADVSRICEPFDGIGLRLPDADPADPSQYIMVVECQDELPAWTTLFPDLPFVYINADCHGGDCLYTGYVCRNGAKVDEERPGELDVFSNPGALTRLLSHLGANLAHDEYFRPFERDYPWRTEN